MKARIALAAASLLAASVALAGPAASTDYVEVPWVVVTPVSVAAKDVRDAGLEPRSNGNTGPNAYVAAQSPVGGRWVPVGSTVTMVTRVGPTP